MDIGDDILRGGFCLPLAQIGQRRVGVTHKYPLQIGFALSVTDDEQLGHKNTPYDVDSTIINGNH